MAIAYYRQLALLVLCSVAAAGGAHAQTRVGDLTLREGEVPVRLVGYGLVVGLDGTGDRSFGSGSGSVHTVRSVTNLLKRFNIEVPGDRLRLRNVAAVLVTAEVSPYLRPGGRFELQVSSLGDATSLRGGVLWITPLVTDPDAPPLATGQGTLSVGSDDRSRYYTTRGASGGRIVDGGVLEVALPPVAKPTAPRLLLRVPDLGVASRIRAVIDSVHGAGTAVVEDPGSILLKLPAQTTDNLVFLAGIDTLSIQVPSEARIVIDARTGMVVAGGDMRLRPASVTLRGITVRIGDPPVAGSRDVVSVAAGGSVRDVAAGLQAFGALPAEVAAVFDALRAAHALTATVIVR